MDLAGSVRALAYSILTWQRETRYRYDMGPEKKSGYEEVKRNEAIKTKMLRKYPGDDNLMLPYVIRPTIQLYFSENGF